MFVSILSVNGVRTEDISDLIGHSAHRHRVRLPCLSESCPAGPVH